MNILLLYFSLFIGDNLFLKIFLWVCLLILGIYIFILEGRIILIKAKIRILLNKVMKNKKEETDPEKISPLTFSKKKLRLLILLWTSITLLTIILTITY